MDEKELVEFTPAEITVSPEMESRAREWLEPYEGMTLDGCLEMKPKELKRQLAELRRGINEIEDARKAVKRGYNEPLTRFENWVKELLAPAREAEATMKAAQSQQELAQQGERKDALREYYAEQAALLVPVVPLETIADPKWWLTQSGYKRALNGEFLERIRKVSRDWESLKNVDGLYSKPETERDFFTTLNLDEALARDSDRRKRAEAIADMKQEMAPSEPRYAWRIEFAATQSQSVEICNVLEGMGITFAQKVFDADSRKWKEA